MTFLVSKNYITFFFSLIIYSSYGHQQCQDSIQLFLDIDRIDIKSYIQIRKSKSKPVIVDIGGEGNNLDAININPQKYTSETDNINPIPLWVEGVGESIPVKKEEVDYLILENTPLNDLIINEITRVIKRDGKIRLVHPIEYALKTHSKFAKHYPRAKVSQKRLRYGLLETVIELKPN